MGNLSQQFRNGIRFESESAQENLSSYYEMVISFYLWGSGQGGNPIGKVLVIERS